MFTNVTQTIKQERSGADSGIDDSLLYQVAGGDREAFARLYRNTKSSVYGFALSILKNRQDAEDIMQDTYLQIQVNAPHYQGQGKPMAWILTIVRNLCLMKIRESKKVVDLPELEWEKMQGSGGMEGKEDSMLLKAAMTVLTDQERMIISLHALSGCRHREIAEILQLPLPTVLSKYHRGLKKMRKQLEGETII